MKLSKETLNIFKNYAGINSNLLLKEGNKLSTMSSAKNVMSDTNVAEVFPMDFGIYDLNEFLGVISLFSDPELEFNEKFVTIKEAGNSIKYFAAEASVLTAPKKSLVFPDSDIEFTLTANMLQMILKTSSVLRASDMTVSGDGEHLSIQVGDKKNSTGNSYNSNVGETTKTFTVNLKVDNLKMLPGDYIVSISNKKISRFKSVTGDLVYFVAVEADSTFA